MPSRAGRSATCGSTARANSRRVRWSISTLPACWKKPAAGASALRRSNEKDKSIRNEREERTDRALLLSSRTKLLKSQDEVNSTAHNADPEELARFGKLASRWWDPD